MEQQTGSKLGKEYVKAVYRHPAYLTNMESSVQFSRSVVSDSLQPQGLQHARPPCPSLSSLSQSLLKLMSIESVMPSNLSHPLSSPSFPCPQTFPASGSFLMTRHFTSGGQSIGVSASTSVLPMNTQDWFPLKLTGLISLQFQGTLKSSPIPLFKSISSLVLSFLYGPTLTSIRDYWKNHTFDYMDLIQQSDVSAF